jgi:hypothetical protein
MLPDALAEPLRAHLAVARAQHAADLAQGLGAVWCIESELYFYSKIFGFTPADALAPIEIENL